MVRIAQVTPGSKICPKSQSPQEHLYLDHPNLLLFVVSINTTMWLYLAKCSAPRLCIKKRGSSAWGGGVRVV